MKPFPSTLAPRALQHQTRQSRRFLSATPKRLSNSNASSNPTTPTPPSKWLTHTRSRIGKCIMFGLSREQTAQAAEVCGILGREWRELVAGREGFLTGEKRAGLRRRGVQWGEMDCMGHVNNVTYVRYAETARVNWAYNYALHVDPEHKSQWSDLCTPKGDGMILRSIKVDYKFPMTFPDSISVFHKLSTPPTDLDSSSFVLDVLILSELHQRPAARCVEDIVVYDYKAGKKTEIRPWMRKAFERTWVEQEEERRRVKERIEVVEGMVRELEVGSWDREGAVEEIGGKR